jgi:polysaccharide biosynthesis/export protein
VLKLRSLDVAFAGAPKVFSPQRPQRCAESVLRVLSDLCGEFLFACRQEAERSIYTAFRLLGVTLAAALIIALAGIRSLAAQQPPSSAAIPPDGIRAGARPPTPSDYVISPDDLLDITVFDVPEMSHHYRVSPSGSISIPLVDHPIAAAGLTPDGLSGAIRERLQGDGLVRNPEVTIEVAESRLHSVAVEGAVRKPQIYPVFGKTTLLDVLAQAEGLADDAGDLAVVSRGDASLRGAKADGQQGSYPAALQVDLKRLMATNDPNLNIELYPGDRVTVERAGVVYVVGAVNHPGGFVLASQHQPMTVLKALALAEDLKPTARGNDALIIPPKTSGSGNIEGLPVRVKDILARKAADQPLHAGEILFVPDSLGKRAARRAAEAAVEAATGVIIWRLP